MSRLNCVWKAAGLVLLLATAAVALPAQTFTTLQSFGDGYAYPSGLAQGTDGNFYGTAFGDGAGECEGRFGDGNCGEAFKITPSGTLTTIYGFCSRSNCADGEGPIGGVIEGTDSNFYGTTSGGGAAGDGTVFSITASGVLTTVYSFCSRKNCPDGDAPSTLIQATNGTFYGMTSGGGAKEDGTVFGISTKGKLTILHSFKGTDGEGSSAKLVQGTNGSFYGVTPAGGTNADGTVFKITPTGKLTTLHSFNLIDGAAPSTGLAQGANGNFYGTTYNGGANSDICQNSSCGTVFSITPIGTLTTLYSFCTQSNCTDGANPAGLIQATDGNFYGTTSAGGSNGYGTIFTITPTGTLTTLYNFCSQTDCADGDEPAGLVQGTDGSFYGTTSGGGGIYGKGTVFSLSVGLGPFVETIPIAAKVGGTVSILGTSLTGATSVTFNGTSATFTVVSAADITTTVPTGATTGTIQVVTPVVTLSSNVPFRVKN